MDVPLLIVITLPGNQANNMPGSTRIFQEAHVLTARPTAPTMAIYSVAQPLRMRSGDAVKRHLAVMGPTAVGCIKLQTSGLQVPDDQLVFLNTTHCHWKYMKLQNSPFLL
jgi:hypothetical protein